MNKVIYLDMDGCITDFLGSLFLIHGRHDLYKKYEAGLFPNDWMLDGELGDEDSIWAPVKEAGEAFWTELDSYSWTDDLVSFLQEIEALHGVPWCICTDAFATPECPSGKIKWIKKYIPQVPLSRVVMMKEKHRLAYDGALLIDDNTVNCERFFTAGGNFCLFPQSWNSLEHIAAPEDKLEYVKDAIKGFVECQNMIPMESDSMSQEPSSTLENPRCLPLSCGTSQEQ